MSGNAVITIVVVCFTVFCIIDRICAFAENMKQVEEEEWFPTDEEILQEEVRSSSLTDETKEIDE